MADSWVGIYDGVPPDVAFSSTGGKGTPIVIDTGTDTAYYAKPGSGVTPLAGSGSGSQIPIDGVFIAVVSTDPSIMLGYGTWYFLGTSVL